MKKKNKITMKELNKQEREIKKRIKKIDKKLKQRERKEFNLKNLKTTQKLAPYQIFDNDKLAQKIKGMLR